jgi:hypothetical protein
VEGYKGGGPVRKMGYYHAVRLTSMFMEDDQVGEFFCSTCFGDIVNNMSSPIDPRRIGNHKSYFIKSVTPYILGVKTFENCSS